MSRTLERTGFAERLGRDHIYVRAKDAVLAAMKLASMEGGGTLPQVQPVRKYSREPPPRGPIVHDVGASGATGGTKGELAMAAAVGVQKYDNSADSSLPKTA